MRWVLVVILCCLIWIRYLLIDRNTTKLVSGNVVKIVGTVKQDPMRKNGKQTIQLSGITVELIGEERIYYGDKISVIGKLEERVIDGKKLGFVLTQGDLLKLNETSGLKGEIGHLRRKMVDNLLKWLPGDEGALAAGILLGGSGELSYQAKKDFSRVGLTHVVAASGYNVGVVAAWVMAGLSVIWGRRRAIPFAILGIILYVILAGAGAAVIRAGIMASVAWIGLGFGRESDAKWLLVVAGLIMLVSNPLLIGDIGFQLSFAATAGILWLKGPSKDNLLATLKTTLAAQVATTPIILHYFGNLSVISPLVNVAVLWSVPVIMQVTAVGLVIGPVNYLAWPFLRWMMGVVTWSAGWRMANFEVGKMSWGWVGAYYLAGYICIKLWSWRR